MAVREVAGVGIKLVLEAYFPDSRFIQAGGGKFCEKWALIGCKCISDVTEFVTYK